MGRRMKKLFICFSVICIVCFATCTYATILLPVADGHYYYLYDFYDPCGGCPAETLITEIRDMIKIGDAYWKVPGIGSQREISLMENLELIVCLGRHAGKYFGIEEYGIPKPLRRNRKAIMIYHPSYVKKPLFNQADEHKKQTSEVRLCHYPSLTHSIFVLMCIF